MVDVAPKYAAAERARVARHKRWLADLTSGARMRALAKSKKWDKFHRKGTK